MSDDILEPTEEKLDLAAEHLRQGRLVAFPTETVYGLGGSAYSDSAVAAIFQAKGRPAHNPLILHVAGIEQLPLAVRQPLPGSVEPWLTRLLPLWPGPLTIVFPQRADRVVPAATAGLPSVAVRLPAHPVARRLLVRLDFPVAAPSANPSNYVSPTRAAHVLDSLGEQAAMVLDGGTSRCGLESTIVSLTGRQPRLLRHGTLTAETLAARLQLPLEVLLGPPSVEVSAQDQQPRESPGMLARHYSPRTPLRFLDDVAPEDRPSRVGLLAFSSATLAAARGPFEQVRLLSETGELDEIARSLFHALRELDAAGLELLLVDRCPEVGIGRAVMDRLRRATRQAG